MRIETNWKLIRRNKQIATYLFLFSIFVLFGGFFVANGQLFGVEELERFGESLYLVVMPIVLIVGMTSTLFSVRMTNLWVRLPRPEVVIEAALKGIGKKGALYNYYHFPARHVLIAPQGVFAIVTRFQDGVYSVNGEKWKTHRTAIGRILTIFRLDGIGNPTFDAQQAAAHVQKLVDQIAPEIRVQPLIIFVDPRARIEVENSVVPVLYAENKKDPNLRDFLREYPKEERKTLSPEQLEAFDSLTKAAARK